MSNPTVSNPTETAIEYRTPGTVGVPRRQNERRGSIVAVLIISLLASAGARYWADEKREVAIPHRGANAAASSLSGMNSFALGLLLGGLRGPLVMILWTESENNKGNKDLEGVDTQIEWIRLLQPEFDTVHIFQIWNKAYNISVQMANRANKYDVILSALDYANKVDAAKPDDINMVAAIGQLYFDKFGGASEKAYYRKRVRDETLPHVNLSKLRSQNSGWRRVSLDPMLDSSFNLLPELYKPNPRYGPRPAGLPASEEWYDGSQLQYLPKYQPFPDGISPYALAFSYYKRTEVLQNVQKQQHAQLGDMVIDSRPPLALKFWAEEEIEQARRRELQALGVPLKETADDDALQNDLGLLTADVPVDQPIVDANALRLAIADYAHASVVIPDSLTEYVRHILLFPQHEQQYRSYIDELKIEKELADADGLYLQAMVAPAAERASTLAQAGPHYRQARWLTYQLILKYYAEAQYVLPSLPPGFGINRTTEHKGIEDLNYDQSMSSLQKTDQLRAAKSRDNWVNPDRGEFDRFLHRAGLRENVISPK